MECDPSFGHLQVVIHHEPAEIRKESLSSVVNHFHRLDDRSDLFGISVRGHQRIDDLFFHRIQIGDTYYENLTEEKIDQVLNGLD